MTALRVIAWLAAGILVAVGVSSLYRAQDRPAEVFEQPPSAPAPATEPAAAPAVHEHDAAPSPTQRVLAVPELLSASEPLRNNTLLMTIRENDYDCDELTSVEERSDPLGGWRVACRGALVYFVVVGRGGQLVVEPVPVGDNLAIGRDSVPQGQPPNPLSPPNR